MEKFELMVQIAALQEQLVTSNQQHLAMALREELAPIAQVVIDAEYRIHHANPAAAILLGVTREALLERRLDAFFEESSLPHLRTFLSYIATAGRGRCPRLMGLHQHARKHILVDAAELPDQRILCCLVVPP